MPGPTHRPAWSQKLTQPLGRRVPTAYRSTALATIKAVHTLIFASVAAAITLFVIDGARQRGGRRAAYALSIALAEAGIYLSNNQVCPLTPLAEDLGAERGAVADMFLPRWAARRIPLFASAALLVGVALNGRLLLKERRAPS
jgi:hypothetical protein